MTGQPITSADILAAAKVLEWLPEYSHIHKGGEGDYHMTSGVYTTGHAVSGANQISCAGPNALEVFVAFVRQIEAKEGQGDG